MVFQVLSNQYYLNMIQIPGDAASRLVWYDGSDWVHYTEVQMKIPYEL